MNIVFLFLLSWTASAGNQENLRKITDLERIAFGSCSDQKDPQPLWKSLKEDSPDLFVHGGDNIYADTKDVETLRQTWQRLLQQDDYAAFRRETPVIGIWDDHDFGYDDSDGTLSFKEKSQKLFLDFLEVPEDSERRKRKGIYGTHVFGEGTRKIKFLLLDNRYFRNLERSAPLLGEAQWRWLEEELTDSDARLHFLVSGLSVLSPRIPWSDGWADYPEEKERMLKLLKKTRPQAPVFLTGDKHFSSIFQRDGHLEFLSSGLTHNRAWWMQPFLSAFYPHATHKLNYGLIDISWDENAPVLKMEIRIEGPEVETKRVFSWQGNQWKSGAR